MVDTILYKLFVSCSKLIGKFRGSIYSEKTSTNIRYFKELIITYQYRNLFKSFGKNSLISKLRRLDGASNIEIGENVYIGKDSIISCWIDVNPSASIMIGDSTSIGEFNHISSCANVVIGKGVLTGRFVYISDNNHGDYSLKSQTTDYQLGTPPHQKRY